MNQKILTIIIVLLLIGGVVFLVTIGKDSDEKARNNSTTSTQPTSGVIISPIPSPAVTGQAMMEKDEEMMHITLNEQNDSKESGVATIEEVNGKAIVKINLPNNSTVAQPAHLHTGACPTPGGIAYNLTDVVNGKSETKLDVSLTEIKSKLPLALNIHTSASDIKTYVSCGDLK